jgi:hypothetical protein
MTIDHDAKCSRCGKGFAAGETRFVGYDGEGETPRIEHKACQAETAREWIRSESKRLLADYQPPEVNAMTDPQSLPVELPPLPPSALAVNSMFGSAHLIHADACREYARAYATACVLAEREACAQLCDDFERDAQYWGARGFHTVGPATRIRERRHKKEL